MPRTISYDEAVRGNPRAISYAQATGQPPPEAQITPPDRVGLLDLPSFALPETQLQFGALDPNMISGAPEESLGETIKGFGEEAAAPFAEIPKVTPDAGNRGLLRKMGTAEMAASPLGEALLAFGSKDLPEKYGAAAGNVASDLLESVESPIGIATMGAGGVLVGAERAAARELIGKGLGVGFGLMATPGAAEKIAKASVTHDPQDILEAVGATGTAVAPAAPGLKALPRAAFEAGERAGLPMALTTGDQLRAFAREAAEKQLPETQPDAIRRLGIRVPESPFFNPGVMDLAGRAIAEGRGEGVLAPRQEPAIEQLRRELQPPTIEPAGLTPKPDATGGRVSFAAPAERAGVPSAGQTIPPPLPPVKPVPQVRMTGDSLYRHQLAVAEMNSIGDLRRLRDSWEESPNDDRQQHMLELIDKRMDEVREGRKVEYGSGSKRQPLADYVESNAGLPQPPHLIEQVRDVVFSKDRQALEDRRRELAGADQPDAELLAMKQAAPGTPGAKQYNRLKIEAESIPEIENKIEQLRKLMTQRESMPELIQKLPKNYARDLAKFQQQLRSAQATKARLERTAAAPEQAPGVGTRSQANDILRVIDQRLAELRDNVEHPENKALRDTLTKGARQPEPAKGGPKLPTVEVSPSPAVRGRQITSGEEPPSAPPAEPVPKPPPKGPMSPEELAREGDDLAAESDESLVQRTGDQEDFTEQHERREQAVKAVAKTLQIGDIIADPKSGQLYHIRDINEAGHMYAATSPDDQVGRPFAFKAGMRVARAVEETKAQAARLSNIKKEIMPSRRWEGHVAKKPTAKKAGVATKNPVDKIWGKTDPLQFEDLENPRLGLQQPPEGTKFRPPPGGKFPEGTTVKLFRKGTEMYPLMVAVTPDGRVYMMRYRSRVIQDPGIRHHSLWGLEFVTGWFKEENLSPAVQPVYRGDHWAVIDEHTGKEVAYYRDEKLARDYAKKVNAGEKPPAGPQQPPPQEPPAPGPQGARSYFDPRQATMETVAETPTIEQIRTQRRLEQQSTEGGPSAVSPESPQVLRTVQTQPGEGARQVPATEGGGETGVRGGEAQQAPQPNVPQEVAPEVTQFVSDFDSGKRLNTHTALAAGMKARSVADLDALLDSRKKTVAAREAEGEGDFAKRYSAEKDPAKQQAMINERFAKNPQLQREAIEAATNTGSHIEGEGTIPERLGERPLDWRVYPEVMEWLLDHGDEIWTKGKDLKTENASFTAFKEQVSEFEKGQGASIRAFRQALTTVAPQELRESVETAPGEPTVESVTALDPASGAPLSATDALINKLEAAKFPTDPQGRIINPRGQMFAFPHPDAIKMIGQGIWNSAIDAAVGAIKAGRTIAEAIDHAISYIKRQTNFRSEEHEAQIRTNLNHILSEEAKARPTGGAQPPAAGASAGGAALPARVPGPGLDDIYKRFETDPKAFPTIKKVIEAGRRGIGRFIGAFLTEFQPLDELAKSIERSYAAMRPTGTSKLSRVARPKVPRLAAIFEQLKGSSGKAEADVHRFDHAVSELVGNDTKDFNAYMFLQRSLDRLRMDYADLQRALAGENVKRLNRRSVSDYTIPELESKLRTLQQKLGPDKLARFGKAADLYQQYMDQALRLQVDSGRMSQELYNHIKTTNQFYAPFKIMKYLEETSRPEGTGMKVDTTADFTKAMQGIEDPNFKVGDILAAGRQNLVLSRVLAEKNYAMREFAHVASFDRDNLFVRKLKPGEKAPFKMSVVNVMENGRIDRYAVSQEVSDAVNIYNNRSAEAVSKFLRVTGALMRAGATTANLSFQAVNLLLADLPRSALVSKYGIGGPFSPFSYQFAKNVLIDTAFLRFPAHFVGSLLSAMEHNVDAFRLVGKGVREIASQVSGRDVRTPKLFMDYLDSGAAGAVIQDYLTPKKLRFFDPKTSLPRRFARSVLMTIPEFATAIEEANKTLGVKRAMLFHGVESGKELSRKVPSAVTEIRRFSGSPDFGRMGSWIKAARANLLFMFLNARIQGPAADFGRAFGRDGLTPAAASWARMGIVMGVPTAILYYINHLPQYRADYESRPKNEKDNYWLIPRDSYVTDDRGNLMRDYWRIPKRESAQIMANMVESALGFAEKRDPQAFWDFGVDAMENLSPLNIRGDTLQERMESSVSSLNPLFKAPIELGTGRDTFRHRQIVPEFPMKRATPTLQYLDRTPVLYRKLATLMPDVMPDALRSPLMLENLTQNLTANLIDQFLPSRPIKGREGWQSFPLLRRFQAATYSDESDQRRLVNQYQREAADKVLMRDRDARMAVLNAHTPEEIAKYIAKNYGQDENAPRIFERALDFWLAEKNGITRSERSVLALPVEQRAEFVMQKLKGLSANDKLKLLNDYTAKRIITDEVLDEMTKQIATPK